MERIIDPILSDIQVEYDVEMRRGRVWRGRWVQVAGFVTLLKVLAANGVNGFLHWTPEDRQTLLRTIAFVVPITGIATLLLEVPILMNTAAREGVPYFEPFMVLVPQALPLAIPIGFVLGMVGSAAKRSRSTRSFKVILLLALACSAVACLDVFWILPGANQAFRVLAGGPQVLRGASELTNGELRALLWGPVHYQPSDPLLPHDWPTLAFAYYTRWALSCTTLVFALFTFSAPAGRQWRGLAASAALVGYCQLMYGGRPLVMNGTLPAYAAAWLPNVTLLLAAIAFMAFRIRRALQSPAP